MMMTTTPADRLVADYVAALRRAVADLPFADANELVGDIAHHIAEARADLDPERESDVRAILDRLGPPEEIAASARSGERAPFAAPVGPPSMPAREATPPPAGPLEYVGIAALAISPFMLPIIGPAIGLILVSTSECWTVRQKVAAWAITLLPIPLLIMIGAAAGLLAASPVSAMKPWHLTVLVLVVASLSSVLAAIVLFVQLRRRRVG